MAGVLAFGEWSKPLPTKTHPDQRNNPSNRPIRVSWSFQNREFVFGPENFSPFIGDFVSPAL
jgi:hypothetical protein